MDFVEGTGSGKMLTYFRVLGRVTVALNVVQVASCELEYICSLQPSLSDLNLTSQLSQHNLYLFPSKLCNRDINHIFPVRCFTYGQEDQSTHG